jgi:hypothetical protein
MRNNARKLVILVEDHTVRTGRAATVDAARAQDRELIVGGGDAEVEALVVVVDVRVVVDVVAGRVQRVALALGGRDGRRGIADTAAGVGAGLAGLDLDGGGEGQRAGEEEGDEGLDR